MFSIVLVDDHRILQQGLRRSIEAIDDLRVIASAETAKEGLAAIERSQPDLALFDLGLPDHTGLWLIKKVRMVRPKLPILVLSMHTEERVIASALRAGANGFVHKSASENTLVQAIRQLLSGGSFLESDLAQRLALVESGQDFLSKRYLNRAHDTVLSSKEIEVLRLVSSGHANRAIASNLGLSISTVKARLRAVFRKLNVETRTEAVASALSHGILDSRKI